MAFFVNSPSSSHSRGPDSTASHRSNLTAQPRDSEFHDGRPSSHSSTETPPNTDIYGGTPIMPLNTQSSSSFSSSKRSNGRAQLGSIDEHGGMAPDIPPRASERSLQQPQIPPFAPSRSLFSSIFSNRSPDDDEGDYDSVRGPKGEKFQDLRANVVSPIPTMKQRVKKRWRCWLATLLLVIVLSAAAAIGVIVALTRKKRHGSSGGSLPSGAGGDDDNSAITTFPTGTWTLTTFLLNVATGCTPNPSTWRCFPYQTLSQSQSGSQTMLTWRITGTNDSGTATYSIMSDGNLFALSFNSTPLTLQNQGQADEYWGFSLDDEKVVVPDAAITEDGSAAQCDYDRTVLSAKLFTKKKSSIGGAPVSGQWPNAVEVRQVSGVGPNCAKTVDGRETEPVPLSGEAPGGDCICGYANFDQ